MPFQQRGLTLVELLVAMLMGAVLLTGLVQIAAGARSSFRLQEAVADMQESERFVIDTLGGILRQSDFRPQPWSDAPEAAGFTAESMGTAGSHADRLAVRTWSEFNCFDNLNPVVDAGGRPQVFLKESVLELNGSDNLTHTCRYGASAAAFTTQIQRQGLVERVEAFHVLYAEDLDGDGAADRWVAGGQWLDEKRVLGVQIALLLRGRDMVKEPSAQAYPMLDHLVTAPADGKLRRVVNVALALRGRIG
jgi:type IV pilus assembly protein PilW